MFAPVRTLNPVDCKCTSKRQSSYTSVPTCCGGSERESEHVQTKKTKQNLTVFWESATASNSSIFKSFLYLPRPALKCLIWFKLCLATALLATTSKEKNVISSESHSQPPTHSHNLVTYRLLSSPFNPSCQNTVFLNSTIHNLATGRTGQKCDF